MSIALFWRRIRGLKFWFPVAGFVRGQAWRSAGKAHAAGEKTYRPVSFLSSPHAHDQGQPEEGVVLLPYPPTLRGLKTVEQGPRIAADLFAVL